MTSIAERKTKLIIEMSDCVRERGKLREIIFEAHPYHMSVRLKGMRQSYDISGASIYGLAVKQAVEASRREKKARKRT